MVVGGRVDVSEFSVLAVEANRVRDMFRKSCGPNALSGENCSSFCCYIYIQGCQGLLPLQLEYSLGRSRQSATLYERQAGP